MDALILRIEPLSPFGSTLMGDMLFGQLCWAVRHRLGEDRLRELLQGYTRGQPFAVVSDALPEGHLPRPALPLSLFREVADADRKQLKKRIWLPLEALGQSLPDWLGACRSERDLLAAAARAGDARPPAALSLLHPQPHNSISRLTGTTGRGDFAPYTLMQRWHAPGIALTCRVLFDGERIQADELSQLFADIGATGFGRDASTGLGKFRAEPIAEPWPGQAEGNACLTLAPCAPQGLGLDPRRSFYEVFTRFGRHGDAAVHRGNPFKTPVLLARAGALLSPRQPTGARFIGQGLGGDGSLSKVMPETVQQGYAPCIQVHLPAEVAA
jgi:CRISPR-associated protein Csm4